MKIYSISDLHLSTNNPKPMDIFGPVWENHMQQIEEDWKEKVREDDVVLIGGDISWAMLFEDSKPDIKYIGSLPGKKVMIRGNHDYWWKSISALRNILPENMYALQNDAIKIGNYIFCGTRGWAVPENANPTIEDKKIYDREVIRLKLSLSEAKKLKTDSEKIIALIHYPPFNSRRQESEFTKLFSEYNISAVIYGHLHGKNSRTDKIMTMNNIPYYLTSCDMVDNKLVEIETME